MKRSWSILLLTLLSLAIRPVPALCEEAGAAHLDDIVLQDLKGRDVDLGRHKGKVVILSFFGEKCAPCKKEAAEFAKLKKKYGDRLVLLSVGIDVDEAGNLEKIARGYGVTWSVLYDRESWLANSLGVTGVPYTAVFDDRGVLAGTYEGLPEGGNLEERISALVHRRGVFVGKIVLAMENDGKGRRTLATISKALRGVGVALAADRHSAKYEIRGSVTPMGEVTAVELEARLIGTGGKTVCRSEDVLESGAVERTTESLGACLLKLGQ